MPFIYRTRSFIITIFSRVLPILRVVPNKLLGIALQTLIPLGLMILPFIENINKFANPFRRPVAMSLFLFGTVLTMEVVLFNLAQEQLFLRSMLILRMMVCI